MLPLAEPSVDGPARAGPWTVKRGRVRDDVWEMLDAASATMAARFAHVARGRARKLEAAVDWLRDAVHGVAEHGHVESLPQAEVPFHRMLFQLRSEFLLAVQSVEHRRDAQEIVRVLLALEEVQRAIDQSSRSDRDLADELLGLHGRNLVVQIAHDMRSPLTSILFLVNTLRTGQSGPVSPVQERQLDLIYGSAFGLSALVNDVVELSQSSERMLEYEPIPFSISEMLHALRDVLQPIAEEKQLELRLERPVGDARLGYPAALSRVLLNLATNALKFTEHGYVAIAVRELGSTRVEVSVEDTGYGVPDEVLDALFPVGGVRRRRTPSGFVGTGLGLGISRELVSAMGSTLLVDRERERGSRFWFELELPALPSER